MRTKERSGRKGAWLPWLALAPCLLFNGACERRVLIEHAELRAEIESQSALLKEMEEALREAEREAEAAAAERERRRPEAPLQVPASNFSVVIELVPADRDRFQKAILDGDDAHFYKAFGNNPGKRIVAGKCAPPPNNYGLATFHHSNTELLEGIDEYAPIAGDEPNPPILPQSTSDKSGDRYEFELKVLTSRDGRCLAEVSAGIDKPLPPADFPLSKIYADRDPGTIPMRRMHSSSFRTTAVLPLGEPTFLGMVERARGNEDGTLWLVFATVREVAE